MIGALSKSLHPQHFIILTLVGCEAVVFKKFLYHLLSPHSLWSLSTTYFFFLFFLRVSLLSHRFHSFHVKFYMYLECPVWFLVLLKRKRIENTSQVQQISDILIAGPLWNVCIKVDTPQTAISVHHPGLPNLMIYVLFHLSGWCHFCRIQQVHWTILGAKSQLHCISAW